jgi:hypothetical protein
MLFMTRLPLGRRSEARINVESLRFPRYHRLTL